MNINEMKNALEILSALESRTTFPAQNSHWKLNQNYMIRTVTHINIGTLVEVNDKELVLIDASWIADTGRFEQAVKDGTLSEVEPFPDGEYVIVGRGALIDAVRWRHSLPREQK